jgi:hypothetical protein
VKIGEPVGRSKHEPVQPIENFNEFITYDNISISIEYPKLLLEERT